MKHILLIATGGTIACAKTQDGLAPALSPGQLLGRVPDARSFCQVDSATAQIPWPTLPLPSPI